MLSFKQKLVAGLIGTGVVAGGGLAWANWSASGTGSAESKALSAAGVTVSTATATADLYPGFTDGDLYFTLTNTNPYPIEFTSMTPGTITSSNAAACPASNVTVDSASGLSVTVAANGSNVARTINDVVNMAYAAPNGCQGVTFTVSVTLSGAQTP